MHVAVPLVAPEPAARAAAPVALGLSVVVPVYDEAHVLDVSIARIVDHVGALEPAFELIVVDDGSRDTSLALLEKWCERVPELRVVRHARIRG